MLGNQSGDPWPVFGHTCVDQWDQVDDGADNREFTNEAALIHFRQKSEEKKHTKD